jgi:hypothetical protein
VSGAVKQLLSASSRLAREQHDDDLEDVVAWLAPGKATRAGALVDPGVQAHRERQRDDEHHRGTPLPPDVARRLAAELDVDLRDV